jgi:hypothetical protein
MGTIAEAINHIIVVWVAHPQDKTALIVHHLHSMQGSGKYNNGSSGMKDRRKNASTDSPCHTVTKIQTTYTHNRYPVHKMQGTPEYR